MEESEGDKDENEDKVGSAVNDSVDENVIKGVCGDGDNNSDRKAEEVDGREDSEDENKAGGCVDGNESCWDEVGGEDENDKLSADVDSEFE